MINLIPMTIYDKIHNDERDRSFGYFEKFENNHLYFSRKGKLDCKINYHVNFVPNRVSLRACHDAILSIHDWKLTNFFDKFSDLSLGSTGFQTQVEIKIWFNQNVASNLEQKTAIHNIVNCSSLPCPYVVLGPPGKFHRKFLKNKLTNKLIDFCRNW
jgi:hypothetical protein